MKHTLLDYRWDEYSQTGEDGIIDELCNRLDISGGWFCEFGAWDGKHLSNTYNLVDNNGQWNGVLIEGDPERYEDLKETISEHPDQLHGINSFVTAEGDTSLDNLLDETDIPEQFKLLSIDIDGPDYFVWEKMTTYSPKVVVIEMNPELGPDLRFISEMSPNGRFKIDPTRTSHSPNFPKERKGDRIRLFGTSFRSMVNLGERKGYTPVSCTRNNLIFVQDRLADKVNLTPEEYTDPTHLFLDEWVQPQPFYNTSMTENIEMIRSSIEKNGVVRTIKLGASKIRNDLSL